MLGGVDEKASDYSVDKAFFLSLRNVDFDVPNALQKRPGSTQMVSVGTSGPIRSLFEFEKLTGESYVIAGSDTALFHVGAAAYSLIDSGWNNGQPVDMLTFVNKLWAADGGRFKSWNGSTMYAGGLPCAPTGVSSTVISGGGATMFKVGGATMLQSYNNASWVVRGVYVAYSYLRTDGYFGPADLTTARNVAYFGNGISPATNGDELFYTPFSNLLFGFTAASGRGITAVAIWVGVDSIDVATTTTANIPGATDPQTGSANVPVGNLGYKISNNVANSVAMSYSLKPGADLARFHLFSLIPVSSLFAYEYSGGLTAFAATFFSGTGVPVTGFAFNNFTGIASGAGAFTGMPFCWFDTNTPKYIEVNQNVMFMSGFSAAPSNVWFSEIAKPENIEPENFFEVRTNDGDQVRATKAFQSTVLVMKEKSFHKVIGDNPDNFQLVELSTQYGCLSNKSVVEFQEKLLWLDKQGILEYNGSAWNIISTPVEDAFRRMNLSAAREKACAANWSSRNQVWFGIPVDGSTENNLTVVYDYFVNAWTFFDGFNASAFAMIKAGGNAPTMWRGSNSGMIYAHGSSHFGDNGSGITCLGLTPFDKAKENETWLWRRFFLDVAPVSGATGAIDLKVFADYNRSTVRATFTMYQSVFQSRAEIGVPGKAVAAQFAHHSASLPLLVNGYGWTKRYLRNV